MMPTMSAAAMEVMEMIACPEEFVPKLRANPPMPHTRMALTT